MQIAKTLLVAVSASLLAVTPRTTQAETLYGVTSTNRLVSFDSATPGNFLTNVAITGNESPVISNIDFRLSTGQLYGVSADYSLYTINPATGVSTLVGSTGLTGNILGVNFNQTADRIRVTTETGGNFRLNQTAVTNGAVTTITDPGLVYSPGDVNTGTPAIGAAGYNFANSSTALTLYFLDYNTNTLAASTTPTFFNNLNTLGGLGIDIAAAQAGFDISFSGAAYASLSLNGTSYGLYSINLSSAAGTTNRATSIGAFSTPVISITSPIPEPGSIAALLAGGLAMAVALYRRQTRAV